MKIKKKKTFIILGFGIAILALTSPLMFRGWRQFRRFNDSFAHYSSALKAKNFQMAYEMASVEFKKSTPYREFVDLHEKMISNWGELRTIENGSTVVEGQKETTEWVAIRDAKLVFERGSLVRFWFRYSAGEWKLYGMERR